MINIQKNVILAPYTTFKIGGTARYFVMIQNESEIIEAIKYVQENNLNYFILGGGSNVLFSDQGFDGLVIKIQNTKYKIENTRIECEAGVSLSEIVLKSVENSLSGLKWAMGIPGTLGGAIRGNAGAFGSEIGDLIKNTRVFDLKDLQFKIYDLKICNFSYRNSVFKNIQNLIIISAILELKKSNQKESLEKIKKIIKKRKKKQPQFPSAGSFFRNPVIKNGSRLSAGWLIEKAGLRGKKIGGAQISEKHANFIINTGKATARDVIILSGIVEQKIRSLFGVRLQKEVQIVGLD